MDGYFCIYRSASDGGHLASKSLAEDSLVRYLYQKSLELARAHATNRVTPIYSLLHARNISDSLDLRYYIPREAILTSGTRSAVFHLFGCASICVTTIVWSFDGKQWTLPSNYRDMVSAEARSREIIFLDDAKHYFVSCALQIHFATLMARFRSSSCRVGTTNTASIGLGQSHHACILIRVALVSFQLTVCPLVARGQCSALTPIISPLCAISRYEAAPGRRPQGTHPPSSRYVAS